MSLKMFTVFVRNDSTKEIASFAGQGETLEAALKDAVATINMPFRPSSNGLQNEHHHKILPLNVTLPDGRQVSRLKADFESDKPYQEEA